MTQPKTLSTKQSRSLPVRRPAVVFQPNLIDGMNLIADVVKPTLGPLPRTVGIENTTTRDRPPEVLDSAGVIARRIIQVGGLTRDAGAMMMRHAIWRMHETCGDGAATVAVLAQAIMLQATKAVAAGAHPALIKQGIELGTRQAATALSAQAMRLPGGKPGRDLLADLARTLCPDTELAEVLVEIVEITGADGAVHVINSDSRRIEREYVEGAMWEWEWLTSGFATDVSQHIVRATDAAVVVLDGKLDNAENTIEGLRRLYTLGKTSLVLIAEDVTDEAKGVLIQAKLRGGFTIVPVKAIVNDAKRVVALSDIAALTGARILFDNSLGFAAMTEDDLGHVRRAWVTAKQFGLIGGQRDPMALRHNIELVRKQIDDTDNLDEIAELRLRLGRLAGGLALVRVGAATSKMQEDRKDQAIRLSRALQMATRRGLIPGGGAALLKASEAINPNGAVSDIAFGMRCVARGLEAPLATIAANSGHDPSTIVHQARMASATREARVYGLDARTGQIVDMLGAGIVDAAETAVRALQVASSLAAMAITTDAVIHHRQPAISALP